MRAMGRFVLVTLMFLTPTAAFAQSETESSSSVVWDVAKSVVLDPTTYAPAVFSYTSMKLDWNTSQPLFQNGWVEQNHRFTLSGRANDLPVSYAEGNARIRKMALMHLQESIVNNVAANVFERVLTNRYPQHRKLFKVLSWAERIAFASYVSYVASKSHFEQADRNRQLARQYGYGY
jgi:hypothetical protein